MKIGFHSVTIMLSIIGMAYMIYGGHLFLLMYFTPDVAAGMLGGILLLSAVIVYGVSYVIMMNLRKKENAQKREIEEMLSEMLENLTFLNPDELEQYIRDNPKTATTLATAAGGLVGSRIM